MEVGNAMGLGHPAMSVRVSHIKVVALSCAWRCSQSARLSTSHITSSMWRSVHVTLASSVMCFIVCACQSHKGGRSLMCFYCLKGAPVFEPQSPASRNNQSTAVCSIASTPTTALQTVSKPTENNEPYPCKFTLMSVIYWRWKQITDLQRNAYTFNCDQTLTYFFGKKICTRAPLFNVWIPYSIGKYFDPQPHDYRRQRVQSMTLYNDICFRINIPGGSKNWKIGWE